MFINESEKVAKYCYANEQLKENINKFEQN